MGYEGIRGRTGARAWEVIHIYTGSFTPSPDPTPFYRRLISTRKGGLTTNGIHLLIPASLSNRSGPPQYVPVKLDRKGKVVVCGQLRRHQGELYVLCHSAARASKDRAIRQRFEQRLEQDADKLKVRVAAGRLKINWARLTFLLIPLI